MSKTIISCLFEAGDLFAWLSLDNFSSLAAAQEAITNGLRVMWRDDEIAIVSEDQVIRSLAEDRGDEVGRWQSGTDRNSQEGFFAACIGLADFHSQLPKNVELPLRWWSVF